MINSQIPSSAAGPAGLKEALAKNVAERAASDALALDNIGNAAQAKMIEVDATEIAHASTLIKKEKGLERPKAKGKTKEIEKTEKGLVIRQDLGALAERFRQRENNREYGLPNDGLIRLASHLGDSITPDMDPEELINQIMVELRVGGVEPKPAQVDKAFDFLLEVVQTQLDAFEGAETDYWDNLYETIANVKVQYYERFQFNIEREHGIIGLADKLVTENRPTAACLSATEELMDLPQDAHAHHEYLIKKGLKHSGIIQILKTLREEIAKKLRTTSKSALKLENPHLMNLLIEIRISQAVIGVYNESKIQARSMFTYLDMVRGLFHG